MMFVNIDKWCHLSMYKNIILCSVAKLTLNKWCPPDSAGDITSTVIVLNKHIVCYVKLVTYITIWSSL